MICQPYHWRNKQPLAEHYIEQFDRVRVLYDYSPQEESSWRARATELEQTPEQRADRQQLARILRSYNERIGNSTVALTGIDALKQQDTLVVVGGQQAGLFTGPLLVIHKAVTVLKTAQRASRQLQRKVLPVFWIAGEDHDWEEANHYYGLNGELEVEKHKLVVHAVSAGRTSVSLVEVEPGEWSKAIEELGGMLPDSEFKPDLLERLTEIHQQAGNLTEATARILAWLLGDHGLIVMDSADPELRGLESPMFLAQLDQGRELVAALRQGQSDVEKLGYTAQAPVQSDSAQLFVLDEEERRLLYRDADGSFQDKQGRRTYTEEQLRDWAREEPHRFSNNALTRPIMQGYVLPVLACVLGPSELAYWGMLRPAFQLHGQRMPILVPRMEFTFIEPRVRKHLDQYGLCFEDAVTRLNELRDTWLQGQDQHGWAGRFDEARTAFLAVYEPLLYDVAKHQPGLTKLGETNRTKLVEQIEFMKKRSIEAYQSQFDTGLKRWRKVEQSLLPLGKPQERVYNIFTYLNTYGRDWLDAWIASVPEEDGGQHHIVQL